MCQLNYIKDRHRHLLKLKQSQQHTLTSTEQAELESYSAMLESQIEWETKDQYFEFLDQLNQGEIDFFDFSLNLYQQVQKNSEIFEILETNYILLSIDQKAKKFDQLIIEILDLCDSFKEIGESISPGEKWDQYNLEFKYSINKIYSEIKKLISE